MGRHLRVPSQRPAQAPCPHLPTPVPRLVRAGGSSPLDFGGWTGISCVASVHVLFGTVLELFPRHSLPCCRFFSPLMFGSACLAVIVEDKPCETSGPEGRCLAASKLRDVGLQAVWNVGQDSCRTLQGRGVGQTQDSPRRIESFMSDFRCRFCRK